MQSAFGARSDMAEWVGGRIDCGRRGVLTHDALSQTHSDNRGKQMRDRRRGLRLNTCVALSAKTL